MSRIFALVFLMLITSSTYSLADDQVPLIRTSTGDVLHGAVAGGSKAGGDTINLMAPHDDPTNGPGEPHYFGDFETAGGAGSWNGWTSVDNTVQTETHWQISNYNQDNPSDLAAWCGDITFPACNNGLDPVGGYGNDWHDILAFYHEVPNPMVSTAVTVSGQVRMDIEPAYDYVFLSVHGPGYFTDLANWTGKMDFDLDEGTIVLPSEYENGTDVAIFIRFRSDAIWSDEDCMFPTAGALQIDNLKVHLINDGAELDFFTDFEDSTFGYWETALPPGVGDFAKIWTGLMDLDPCRDNFSPQVAFIDDGQVVPGTGGSECLNWCYGPQGYIVNTTGGLAGPQEHIDNYILSPVMDWPSFDYDGIEFLFEVYRHEDMGRDSPGVFFGWDVRSADTDGNAGNGVQDLEEQPWRNRGFLESGGPEYLTYGGDVSDLMNPGRDLVQVRLGVREIGWTFGLTGDDGYPAPFFDNVRVKVFPFQGPSITALEIDLAQDNFPERGSIDFDDLGTHDVRFDMARNISPANHLLNDPGDSLSLKVAAVRAGSDLVGSPTLHYSLKRNPVFDAYRSAGKPDQGFVAGNQNASAAPGDPRYFFDLPDTGFLFPGDVLHYFIQATDAVGGTDLRTTIIPADTTGFSGAFDHPLGYHSSFTMRALPTITEDGFGGYETPPFLFWNDFGNIGGEIEWYTALNAISFGLGRDYDIYYTNGPSSGVGNGLGGRAGTHLNLQHYTDLLYTCGDLLSFTLSPASFAQDAGDDLGVLRNWLELGGRDMFMTGDDLVSDLISTRELDALAFVEDVLGVRLVQDDIRSFINNQTTPLVWALPGNPVFFNVDSWIAFGACPRVNRFDAVEPVGSATRLSEFLAPGGIGGAYMYSAATLNYLGSAPSSRVVSLPYDFSFIHDESGKKATAPLAARTRMLRDVTSFFGHSVIYDPVPVPLTLKFSAQQHPNPFNPRTNISVTMPEAGLLEVNVYDIRGQLVRSLHEGPAGAGQHSLTWDGTNDRGLAVSSGVYFFHVRAGEDVQIGKMALIK